MTKEKLLPKMDELPDRIQVGQRSTDSVDKPKDTQIAQQNEKKMSVSQFKFYREKQENKGPSMFP